MYSKFQKDGSAETLTLEVIGITTDVDKLNSEGTPNLRGNPHARELASAIETVLERDGRAMDPQFADLLREAKPYLRAVGSMPSTTATDILDFGTKRARLESNPAFAAKLTEMRDQVGPRAQDLFDQRFLPELKDALHEAHGILMHGTDRDGETLRLAMSMGRV
ncbi:MAG: hypothetical protein AAF556_10835 [Pseudomonadota bacterium]